MPESLRIKPKTYFYSEQLRKYIIQFMAIFSEMQVSIGRNDNSDTSLIFVPIKYGSTDRVVGAIKSSHTQNKPIKLPIMAAQLTGVQMHPEARKGVGTYDRDVELPVGGSLPDDIKVVHRYMPIPYLLQLDLSILASNTDQHFQLLEQIMMLFDPDLQFQTSDDKNDWSKINKVTLEGISMDETYPAENAPRIITSTFSFSVVCYMSPPVNIKSNYIKSIKIRLENMATGADMETVLADVTRTDPPYETLFDIDDYEIPPN